MGMCKFQILSPFLLLKLSYLLQFSASALVNNWRVSQITDFSNLFKDNRSFDSPIGSWDVVSGTNFAGMFDGATSFNHPIGNWDVRQGVSFVSDVLWCPCFVIWITDVL